MKHAKSKAKLPVAGLAAVFLFGAGCAGGSLPGSKPEEDSPSQQEKVSVTKKNDPTAVYGEPNSDVTLRITGENPGFSLTGSGIEVLNPDGTTAGLLELTSARVALHKIKLKPFELGSGGDAGTELLLSGDENETEDEAEGSKGEETPEGKAEEEKEDAAGGAEGEDDDEFEFKGPFLVDLLTNTVSPEGNAIKLPAGNYRSLELGVHKIEDEDAATLGVAKSDPMFKQSIYVAGTFTPAGGAPVSFQMSYAVSEEFKLGGKEGVNIEAGSANSLVIAFRLSSWFNFANPATNPKSVSMASLAGADIMINDESEEAVRAVRDVIKENIKRSADFGKDVDGDGKLSDDEDAESPDEDDMEEEQVKDPADQASKDEVEAKEENTVTGAIDQKV